MVLPDMNDGSGHTMRLAVGAGKDGNLYVVNRDSMGKLSPNDSNIYQELAALPNGVWSTPAYFNNTIYYGSVENPLRAFTIANAKVPSISTAQTTNSFAYPGATPMVSADATKNGIIWVVENSTPLVLRAYTAASLNELYNSNEVGSRDQLGNGANLITPFITPTIANAKVFVGVPNGVVVFGLLPKS
jgi:hypothetical protein